MSIGSLRKIVFIACSTLPTIGCSQEVAPLIERNQQDVAAYEHMRFHGGTEEFRFFHTGSRDGGPVAHVYLRVNEKDVFFLPDLKEEDIAKAVRTRFESKEMNVIKYKRTGFYSFWFRDGRLLLAYFNLHSKPFEIGPTKDGPFRPIPISRKDMIELFGEPKSWGKANILAP